MKHEDVQFWRFLFKNFCFRIRTTWINDHCCWHHLDHHWCHKDHNYDKYIFLLPPLGSPLPRHESLLALSMKLWISKDYFTIAAVGKLCCLIAYKVNRNLYLFIAYNVNSNLYRSIVWKQSIKPFTTYKVNQILTSNRVAYQCSQSTMPSSQ